MTVAHVNGVDPELVAWVEAVTGAAVSGTTRLVGGNRRQAWGVDVVGGPPLFLRYASGDGQQGADPYTLQREAAFYRALSGTAAPMPRFVAAHPTRPAFLTERVVGESRYAGSGSAEYLDAVATDVMKRLAALHAVDLRGLELPGYLPQGTIADHVRAELAVWRDMYQEILPRDPLIEFALAWLTGHVPDTAERPVLVHGDAGPGNFLHRNGKVAALIDWELAHIGDPMEDIAWLSVRTTLEPFPDFRRHVQEYVRFAGRRIARDRLLYHRVFVPLRITVLRHRAGAGTPDGDLANSLLSRTLNRRLLVQSLAVAMGIPLASTAAASAAAPAMQREYDYVLALLRDKIASRTTDRVAAAAIKSAARMVKYLASVHRYGAAIEAVAIEDLSALLGVRPTSRAALDAELSERMSQGGLDESRLLAFFSRDVARETQLAGPAMGALAGRSFPPFE
jgi:aminoglycoside phosphotransferase (APT) family kinase protein